jgi:hypothetical protein
MENFKVNSKAPYINYFPYKTKKWITDLQLQIMACAPNAMPLKRYGMSG